MSARPKSNAELTMFCLCKIKMLTRKIAQATDDRKPLLIEEREDYKDMVRVLRGRPYEEKEVA